MEILRECSINEIPRTCRFKWTDLAREFIDSNMACAEVENLGDGDIRNIRSSARASLSRAGLTSKIRVTYAGNRLFFVRK